MSEAAQGPGLEPGALKTPHDNHRHRHDDHSHAGAAHIHAAVDHLTNEDSLGCGLGVRLCAGAMRTMGLAADDLVRIATDRGRSIIARLLPGGGQTNSTDHVIQLDRFVRQALKAHLNEIVEIEKFAAKPVSKVELLPAIDVSMAHDLLPHLKKTMLAQKTPLSVGAVLYIPFPDSFAGTTYEVHKLPDGAGVIGESTEVVLHYHDSHLPEGAFDVTYEDVGGLTKEIKLIRELVQLPLRFPHVYRQLGINAPRGIILYGPPGAGKTHLARAVANEVDARFYYINGPDVIGTYTGETEANLRKMFAEASHHAPSIVFIDELDAIAPKRGETGAHADIRTVTQLLSLMDGLKRVDAVIVIATTNRIDAVDPAFRRPGRFDREIFVGPPDARGRREILSIQTREMPLSNDALVYLDEIAKRTHGYLGADLMELCRNAGLNSLRRNAGSLDDHRAAFRIELRDICIEKEDFVAALSQTSPSALRESLITIPDTKWTDIGGLESVKQRLRDIVELPLRNPALLAASGLPQHTGVLLYGPPGSGKTLLAKAVAREAGVNFISIDGPEIFTKWLGESEEAIRHIFRMVRQVAPAVLFFDQLDSIAPFRGRNLGSLTADRVVSQLLSELDGIEQLPGVVIIGATNRVDLIDPSLLRPGRFGLHLAVGLPDESERASIVALHFGGDRAAVDAITSALAPATEGFSGADLRQIAEDAKRIALRKAGFGRAAEPTSEDALEALALFKAAGTARMRDVGSSPMG